MGSFLNSYFGKHVEKQLLTDGWSSAQLYLITTEEKEYVLRLQEQERLNENYMMAQASLAGIAPHVHYMGEGIILMDFINEGVSLSLDKAKSPDFILKLAETARKIHSIPKDDLISYCLLDKVKGHYNTIKTLGLATENDRLIFDNFEKLYGSLNYQETMTHGDLHAKNMFLTPEGKILLIDWEHAGKGDPFFDISYSASLLTYNEEQEKNYLEAYLGHPLTSLEQEHYRVCKNITALGLYFELSEFAYVANQKKPFNEADDPKQSWTFYVEHFIESKGKMAPKMIYGWANSALRLCGDF